MRESINALVFEACEEHNSFAEPAMHIDLTLKEEAALFGRHGVLDSLALVTLLIALEHKLQGATGKPISLVDEKALSANRSPFATIGSLVDFATALIVPVNGAADKGASCQLP